MGGEFNVCRMRFGDELYVKTIGRKRWGRCPCGNGFNMTDLNLTCEVCSGDRGDDKYIRDVDKMSKLNRRLLPGIERILENGFMPVDFDIDHIVPVWFGVKYRLPVWEMAGVENLQIMSSIDNQFFKPHGKGGRLPEEWFQYITGKKLMFYIAGTGVCWKDLWRLCFHFKLSYVKAASALMKDFQAGGVNLDGRRIIWSTDRPKGSAGWRRVTEIV